MNKHKRPPMSKWTRSMDVISLIGLVNDPTVNNELRSQAQSALLTVQRDPSSWSLVFELFNHPDVQVKFFAAQTLLVKVNRDWDKLPAPEGQESFKTDLQKILFASSLPPKIVTRKLEQVYARVMQKAFSSGWWKDPVGDLLKEIEGTGSESLLRILALSCTAEEDGNNAHYTWMHLVKGQSEGVARILGQSRCSEAWLECIKAWTLASILSFNLLGERILPVLLQCINDNLATNDELDSLLNETFHEIIISPCKDLVEEAKKCRVLLPFINQVITPKIAAAEDSESAADLARLLVGLGETCPNYLVTSVTGSNEVITFFQTMLALTGYNGTAVLEETVSPMTLNFWYLIAEAIEDSEDPANVSNSFSQLLKILTEILINKMKRPSEKKWRATPKDLQQSFQQNAREVSDTLISCCRVLKESAYFALIQGKLQNSLNGDDVEIEVTLRAILAVADEINEWSDSLSSIFNILTTAPSITASTNAEIRRLVVKIIGEYLPAMRKQPLGLAQAACDILLGQLVDPSVGPEAVKALRLATESFESLFTDKNSPFLDRLFSVISSDNNALPEESRSSLFQIVTRLITDLPDASNRLRGLDALFQQCGANRTLLLASFRACCFKDTDTQYLPDSVGSLTGILQRSLSQNDWPVLDGLLTMLLASSSDIYTKYINAAFTGESQILASFLPPVFKAFAVVDLDGQIHCLHILHTFVLGYTDVALAVQVLEETVRLLFQNASSSSNKAFDDLYESLYNLLTAVIEKPELFSRFNLSLLVDPLFTWSVMRIDVGHLSVTLLRNLVRFHIALLAVSSTASSYPSTIIDFIGNLYCQSSPYASRLLLAIFSASMGARVGRNGLESLARILFDWNCAYPNALRLLLNSESFLPESCPEDERKAFLRKLGAAHTLKTFKPVFSEFCLKSRIGNQ